MFKSARWKSEKNKFKVSFKLQFHAAQFEYELLNLLMSVPVVGDDALMISVVPADAGKPSVKSDKAAVREGSCFWENPVYETVKFNREPKSGKIHERIYYFVVGTGSSKAGVIGEASIDFSNYADATKVSIQRINESIDLREVDETENAKLSYKDHSLMSQLSNGDTDGTIKSDSAEDVQFTKSISNNSELIGTHRGSSGSDITMSSSGSSSGVEIPWLGNSALIDDSLSTPREAFKKLNSEEDVIEKLKAEVAVLSRQAEMSELELQTLRKQIVKESKRGQDLFKEVVCLKEERDGLKLECEKLGAKAKTNIGGGDSRVIIEELRQELNHAKELNTNLRIQLQKTQESNSELLLAVRDLDEMLEQKNKEISNPSSGSLEKEMDEKSPGPTRRPNDDVSDDDEEQKALEELVKEHGDAKEAYLLERQIMDMRSEIEIYKRDKDELEMQMEQLALDYEILKQENHEMSYKLEQSEIQEQLKMQYECSSSYATAHELETQIENLENELKIQSKESADAFMTISELESHVKSLEEELKKQSLQFEADFEALMRSKDEQEQKAIRAEKLQIEIENLENELKSRSKESADAFVRISELEDHVKRLEDEIEKQSLGFEADIDAVTRSKVEQEQRAIKAEAILRKTRWQNANTAERIQEEFRRLSVQMGSAFEANEKLASKALAEANELRLQKSRLEEVIEKASEGHELMKVSYEAKLHQLSSQVISMTNQIEQMQTEIETETAKNKILSEEMGSKKILIQELEETRTSVKKIELEMEQGNDERIVLKNEAVELQKELNKMRCVVEEKELIVGNLQLEVDSLQAQYSELKNVLLEDEVEKEKLRKQVLVLRTDLKKKEDEYISMEKKIKNGNVKGTTLDAVRTNTKNSKTLPRGSKEVANLKERIKSLEGQIKLKEVALEASTNTFLGKEKDLHNKIDELEERLEMLNQSSARYCENEAEKEAAIVEFKKEMELVKEKNESMEVELKEMQERYSEISLKFAEVEGERQTLVMRVRNLKNAKKNAHNIPST
ncbi:hypothetical protein BUALT_Bualt10G0045100 [Buddleja alternifolia]|uniref:C2 NT-type domain-containing protein n=1 Tax=Buddleja alternifolia TaxID=168488 RepID=A0AAV6X457_9LAMI|nr:hypothetical protein BUALT_Bualt10G0045100 [Buddleja alternifolia]